MRAAVLLPGIGYHCDKPLLYYAGKLAAQNGFDEIIRLKYSFAGGNIRGDEKAMRAAFDALYEQTEAQLAKIAWDQYEEILLISKSIGTAIAAAFAARHRIKVRHVLYTPLKETYMLEPSGESIAFIGTADPWSDVNKVEEMSRKAGIPMTVIPDANHSLETGDVLRDLSILQDVMEKTKAFL